MVFGIIQTEAHYLAINDNFILAKIFDYLGYI